jgi:anhydro-N-acetylmuramic acid kinase
MKKNVEALFNIAQKQERIILGLMSGTSLDGLDLALCRVRGHGRDTEVTTLFFETVLFESTFQEAVRSVFARQVVDFPRLTQLNPWIARKHADIINDCLGHWGVSSDSVDLIGSHGQTVMHTPRRQREADNFPNATLQIGDGDHLAVYTGIITISDFRQKHLAMGGEGAPLALYGDYFVYSSHEEDRVLLNMGGIANFTYLPADGDPAKVFATDTGPGNTLLDACAQHYFQIPFDRDARIALSGSVVEPLLNHMLADPYFFQSHPKTTGPEQFGMHWIDFQLRHCGMEGISAPDLMATLTALTGRSIARDLANLPTSGLPRVVYLSGGGAHNVGIRRELERHLPGWEVRFSDSMGVSADAKEAVLFAVLANECVSGSRDGLPFLGSLPYTSMGKISFPD